CLQMQSGNVLAQLLHDSDGDKPGHKGGEESDGGAGHHRFAIISPWPRHTGGDGSQNENAFESLTENENTDIERGDGGGGVRSQRVGRTVGCDSLPDENRDHKKRSEQQAHADTDSARKPIFPRGSPADIQLRLVAGFARKRARHTTNLTYRTSIRCRSVAIF